MRFLTTPPLLVLTAAITMAATPMATADDWIVDPDHTEVTFSVNHFFTPVTGKFSNFDVELDYDPANPEASSVEVTIDVASVDTDNDKRDAHLMSEDFFEAETHPQITFKSTSVTADAQGNLVASGPLTIKGISQEIELPIRLLGVKDIPAEMRDMLGGAEKIASFAASAEVDRRDFGVGVGSWAATLVVGGDVGINISLEAALK